jgi:hypothetical protein
MTVTTSMIGVGPKKVPTPQSFLVEIVGMFQICDNLQLIMCRIVNGVLIHLIVSQAYCNWS